MTAKVLDFAEARARLRPGSTPYRPLKFKVELQVGSEPGKVVFAVVRGKGLLAIREFSPDEADIIAATFISAAERARRMTKE